MQVSSMPRFIVVGHKQNDGDGDDDTTTTSTTTILRFLNKQKPTNPRMTGGNGNKPLATRKTTTDNPNILNKKPVLHFAHMGWWGVGLAF